MKNYRNMKENQMRKELVNHITSSCRGLISRNEAKAIVSKLSLSELVNHKYELAITHDVTVAGFHLTLSDSGFAHSWAGSQGCLDEGEVLLGNVEFGEAYSYEYFDNGNSTGLHEYDSLPDFDVSCTLVALINSHEWNHYNGADWDKYKKTILIYLPTAEAKKAATA